VSTRPARLLFVCSSLAGGGAERWVSTVLGQLDRGRFAPELCLLRRQLAYPLPADVPLFALGRRGRLGLAPAVLRLARLVERRRPDLLLSAFAGPSFAAGNALALVRHRPRWVARVSSDPDLTEPGPLLRGWMRALYRRADRLLANAEALRERVERIYAPPGGVGLVPNAVDFAALDALARESAPAAPAGRLRVISVGRLEPVKRFDLLIDAVARLRERFDLELVILGEGAERRRLEARARRLGLSERVLLPGFASNPYAWLARSDLFALVSASEGLPNALLEAQGLGVAVLASHSAGGAVEVVQDGATGRLVRGDDAPAVAEALAALLGDAAQRRALGLRGRERVHARFAAAPATRALEAQLAALSPG
jgi:glycosyltransferase involved in cell wall biosynthesis